RSINETVHMSTPYACRYHRLRRLASDDGVELIGGLEHAADEPRGEDVGDAADVLDVDYPPAAVARHREPVDGHDVGARAVDHVRRARLDLRRRGRHGPAARSERDRD